MFQSFDSSSNPETGPARLAALREVMEGKGLDGFLIPRSDAHQGEYVAPRDDRLAWLTGFTGSAGFAIALTDVAGVFVDGRYRLQVKAQTDQTVYTPVDWPETKPGDWLKDQLGEHTAKIAYDPWLHSVDEIDRLRKSLDGSAITLVESPNLVDRVWEDQPGPPMGVVSLYPEELAGKSSAAKRAEIAAALSEADDSAAVLTLPDSIAWLLNIRGSDIPRIPIAQGFAVIHASGAVDLLMAEAKLGQFSLDAEITVHDPNSFANALAKLAGRVRIDKGSAPVAVKTALETGAAEVTFGKDPCSLPKACKTPAEQTAARAAHLRDGAAMVEFLAWLDQATDAMVAGTGPAITEIDVVEKLEGFRRATNALKDISFDTICGSGPNGAIVHYRVTHSTNRTLQPGELLLVDSGGQYLDGTTDITRTMAVGMPPEVAKAAFTRVLKGLIAISEARFPKGIAGSDLDAVARMSLWQAGQDYGHGTGHGVGQYLSVHEGPQRLSRLGREPLKPGMILSNEPGYYREGAFGIRLENLILVEEAAEIAGGDPERKMHGFETLTYVPFDQRLLEVALLSDSDRAWLNRYHQETRKRLRSLVSDSARTWLDRATAPL
ncbi:MAG: aminopeptidase P family protein [Pseudomonadota bacterium]